MRSGARALLDAARRLGALVAVFGGLTAGVSLLVGSALDVPAGRSVSTGLYLVGSFLLLTGVFAGLRGPVRPRAEDDGNAIGGLFGVGIFSKGMRTASLDERRDARSTSWLFLTLGLILLLLAIAADDRTRLL